MPTSPLLSSLNLVIHCKEYLSYLSQHLPLSHKHYVYSLLYENYFNIIHDRYDDVILPLPAEEKLTTLSSSSSSAPLSSSQLNVKLVLVCPSEANTLQKWLLKKFFDIEHRMGEHDWENMKRVEQFALNSLDENKYGISLVLRLVKGRLSRDEYERCYRNRILYAADCVIYVLMPVASDRLGSDYLKENRDIFQSIVKLSSSIRVIYIRLLSFCLLKFANKILTIKR